MSLSADKLSDGERISRTSPNVDIGVQVDFVYSTPPSRNHQLVDLGYDSLHSTPRQQLQQHNNIEEKELQSFEMEDVTDNSNVKILEYLPKAYSSIEKKPFPESDNLLIPTKNNERLEWDKQMDFLLSIIGFAVDLANVWRFPYLCYKNGGGIFLIPYTLMLIFGALPLFFLELALGQYNKAGPITLWSKICPSMKGVGYCCVLISWYVSFYYNVIIGWTFYYIYVTLTSGSTLPWAHCNNTWNTPNCLAISTIMDGNNVCPNRSVIENQTSSAIEFYKRNLLEIDASPGLSKLGSIRLPIVASVACVFVVLYFSLFKGVKSSGKVVWVTATAPYIILTLLFIRGLFLPGAVDGIKYYLEPRFEELKNTSVWIDAANQVFFSVGVGFGVHLTYASFNKFNNNCHRDALVTVAVNSLTSFYSGFVIFTYLGYMAKGLCKQISEVATEGYGLVFMVYPEAISTLPYAHFWALLFFVMLVTLGLDSAMGGLEAVITGIMDEFNFKKLKREQFTAIVLFLSFSVSLVNTTQGGGYTMFWFDIYAASVSLLCSALFEAIAVSYCYGLDRFCADIKLMLGFYPNIFWRVCWKYVSPAFLLSIVLLTVYQALSSPLIWENYEFPHWAVVCGWIFSCSTAAPIVLIFTYHFIKNRRCTSRGAPLVNKNEVLLPIKSSVYV